MSVRADRPVVISRPMIKEESLREHTTGFVTVFVPVQMFVAAVYLAPWSFFDSLKSADSPAYRRRRIPADGYETTCGVLVCGAPEKPIQLHADVKSAIKVLGFRGC